MLEVWSEIVRWRQAGKSIALATIIQVEGSSLRPTASKMAVTADGDIAGSITGGCVEGAVFEEAQTVIRNGLPKRLSYGISNDTAWEVGLACGGSILVFVESLSEAPWINLEPQIRRYLAEKQLFAVATVVSGSRLGNKMLLLPDGGQAGSLGSPELNTRAARAADHCWETHSPLLAPGRDEFQGTDLFIDVFTPPPRLVIIGAVHIAIPLITIAKAMNFYTIVLDARSTFATRERFPHADELIVNWPATALEKLHPDTETYVVCLSHDDKFDNPVLQSALASPARYIGALGSRKTYANRLSALRELGVPEESLERIHAPVGLKLGSRYPEEIALEIMAEILAVRRGVAVK